LSAFLGGFPGNFWAVFRRLLCWFCVSDLATLLLSVITKLEPSAHWATSEEQQQSGLVHFRTTREYEGLG